MKYKYITSIFVLIYICTIGVLSILKPDREKSELEGRSLQQFPTFTNLKNEKYTESDYIDDLLTGKTFGMWDDYFSDQVYGRDIMVSSYTQLQVALNKQFINDVYIGHDNYLFNIPNLNPAPDLIVEKAERFNEVRKKFTSPEMFLIHLPRKDMIYGDKVPINNFSSPISQHINSFMDNISTDISIIDFRDVITPNDDYYYRTDHHWNMAGVYASYQQIIKTISDKIPVVGNPRPLEDFDIKRYEHVFIGSDGRKLGAVNNYMEVIDVYRMNDINKYTLSSEKEKLKFYFEHVISEDRYNNDYLVYLYGDHPKITINNDNKIDGLTAVIIGDSMDNPLTPLLSYHFKTTYNYDLRHYTGDIYKELEEINPDVILFVGISHAFINDDKVFQFIKEEK